MGLFDHFPYSNFHELNLTWILEMLNEIDKTMSEFVAINALKYADPIQWDITSQYEKNTIVIDPQTGTAYISVQPVPTGVTITNPDYWTVVFDLGSFVVRAAKNFTNNWEPETTLTATFNTNAGDWLIWGDTLYKALVNITAGDTYVVDSNIKHFTAEEVIGHVENLNTTDKTNLVAAINEILVLMGDLNNLTTSDTTSLVNAINSIITLIGDPNDLITVKKDSIVNAINSTAYAINVLSLGCDNTGTSDNRSILDHLPAGVYYFPDGDYIINGRVTLDNEVSLIGQSRNARLLFRDVDESNIYISAICNLSNLSIINEIMTATVFGAIESISSCHFDNLYIETNSIQRSGIMVNAAYQNRYVITNCEINANSYLGDFGIWAATTGGAIATAIVDVESCYIHGFNLNGIFSSARVGHYINNRIKSNHWQTIPTGGGQIDVLSTSSEIAIHVIESNVIEDPGSGAVGIETYHCKAIIRGNTIYGNISESNNVGIATQDSSQDYISNNLFQGCYCGVNILAGSSATIVDNDFYAMGASGCIKINDDTNYDNSIKNNRNYLNQPFITYPSGDIPLYYQQGANTMQQYGIVSNGTLNFKLPYSPSSTNDSYFIVVYYRNEIDIMLLGNDNSIQRDSSKMTTLNVTRSGQIVSFTSTHNDITLLALKLL